MGKLPSFQFYPGDWLKDPALRRCSPAARGVWIDMLCLMFECEERGVLASGGVPWSDREVAAVVSGDTQDVLSCIDELLAKGVAGRNSSGALFSRRLVRDESKRKATRVRVQKYRSNADVTQAVTPKYEDEDEGLAFAGDVAFESFWNFYPAREDGHAAQEAFQRSVMGIAEKRKCSENEAFAWLCERTKIYLKLTPSAFQKGMTKYLSDGTYWQDEAKWRRDEGANVGAPDRRSERIGRKTRAAFDAIRAGAGGASGGLLGTERVRPTTLDGGTQPVPAIGVRGGNS